MKNGESSDQIDFSISNSESATAPVKINEESSLLQKKLLMHQQVMQVKQVLSEHQQQSQSNTQMLPSMGNSKLGSPYESMPPLVLHSPLAMQFAQLAPSLLRNPHISGIHNLVSTIGPASKISEPSSVSLQNVGIVGNSSTAVPGSFTSQSVEGTMGVSNTGSSSVKRMFCGDKSVERPPVTKIHTESTFNIQNVPSPMIHSQSVGHSSALKIVQVGGAPGVGTTTHVNTKIPTSPSVAALRTAVTKCVSCSKDIEIDSRLIPVGVRVICSACEKANATGQIQNMAAAGSLAEVSKQLRAPTTGIQSSSSSIPAPVHQTQSGSLNTAVSTLPVHDVAEAAPPGTIPLVICVACGKDIQIDRRLVPGGVQVICSQCEQKSLPPGQVQQMNAFSSENEPADVSQYVASVGKPSGSDVRKKKKEMEKMIHMQAMQQLTQIQLAEKARQEEWTKKRSKRNKTPQVQSILPKPSEIIPKPIKPINIKQTQIDNMAVNANPVLVNIPHSQQQQNLQKQIDDQTILLCQLEGEQGGQQEGVHHQPTQQETQLLLQQLQKKLLRQQAMAAMKQYDFLQQQQQQRKLQQNQNHQQDKLPNKTQNCQPGVSGGKPQEQEHQDQEQEKQRKRLKEKHQLRLRRQQQQLEEQQQQLDQQLRQQQQHQEQQQQQQQLEQEQQQQQVKKELQLESDWTLIGDLPPVLSTASSTEGGNFTDQYSVPQPSGQGITSKLQSSSIFSQFNDDAFQAFLSTPDDDDEKSVAVNHFENAANDADSFGSINETIDDTITKNDLFNTIRTVGSEEVPTETTVELNMKPADRKRKTFESNIDESSNDKSTSDSLSSKISINREALENLRNKVTPILKLRKWNKDN